MTHTPGPWRVGAGGGIHAGDVGSSRIATTHQRGENFEWQPNAHLIAAAPDLLEVLKTTAGNIESLRAAKVCNTYDNWLETVEAAIAKATCAS